MEDSDIGSAKCFGSCAAKKEIELPQGHAMSDHVHMLLSVPPRYSIAMTTGYLKGKRAIRIHRDYSKVRGTVFGRSFWSCLYCVSTVGFDEESVRRYIQEQEAHEKRQDQYSLSG